jgi:uncharacterized protein with PIN domain
LQERKFLLDGMLGKLARWLRFLGENVAYERNIPDKKLLEKARIEKRILLTSDEDLYKRALSKKVETHLIEVVPVHKMIKGIVDRYEISGEFKQEKSRCPKCGTAVNKIAKTELKGKVPNHSFDRYNKYWICMNEDCKKIYWKGSHWRNITSILKKINNNQEGDVSR